MKTQFAEGWDYILGFLVVFFLDIHAALIAVGFLVMADTFTGIWASWKKHGRKHITSRRLGRVITKLLLYPLALIVAKVAENYLAPAIPWTEVTAGILAAVEVKSIFEKISIILGFDLWDRLKKAIWKPKDIEGHTDKE